MTTEEQLDEILDDLYYGYRYEYSKIPAKNHTLNKPATLRIKKEVHLKPEEAKSVLLKLIREERLQELLNIPFNDGRFSINFIEEHWAARIKQLQEEG